MSETQKNPIIVRLERFIAYTGMSNSQFADRAGIPRPTLSQILHGRNKSINDTLLRKLDESFPQLNLVWLLFERGDMLTDSNFEFSRSSDSRNLEDTGLKDADNENIIHPASLFSQVQETYGNESKTGCDRETGEDTGISSSDAVAAAVSAVGSSTCGKTISSIIVFYSDHSFKTFLPTDS